MKKALKAAMMASISEVLETMFFMSLEFDPQITKRGATKLNSEKNLACQIGFHGEFSGYFALLVPESLLLELTKNFIGQDQTAITEAHLQGTIREMLNMLAGNTLSKFNKSKEFKLDFPELKKVTGLWNLDTESDKEITVITETTSGYLALRMVLDA